MSYQALARKYRPRCFEEIVGQEHVVQALSNAFSQQRLHHALLFSGTRGVGKTTLARIIAKCLNDEAGITATPDLESDTCQAIEAGRFVDLIEVDAASRTGVDDTREMLENVQYAPTQGRYKVYLIDEVHMFSKHSFNALLKTLEEPPPHVQFLLATTDPQKLPVTILSRCLQFHLRRLTVEEIAAQLATILEKENIEAEQGGLIAIATAADGSMRDALSLLDQAIGFGSGKIEEGQVRDMLGIIDRNDVLRLIQALADNDGPTLMKAVKALDQKVPDYDSVLAELSTSLQQIAVVQTVPDAPLPTDQGEQIKALAEKFDPSAIQLNYEIACAARRDLDWSPSHQLGFEMALLRMLAFRPDSLQPGTPAPASNQQQPQPSTHKNTTSAVEPPEIAEPVANTAPTAAPPTKLASLTQILPEDWLEVLQQLDLSPPARELARNCVPETADDGAISLCLAPDLEHLLTDRVSTRLTESLENRMAGDVAVKIVLKEAVAEAPAQTIARHESDKKQAAQDAIHNDPTVQELQRRFGAQVDPNSIQPTEH